MPKPEEAQAALAAMRYVEPGSAGQSSLVSVRELAGGAIARLRRDLERYKPDKPALAYALASETHAVILQEWRAGQPGLFAKLVAALLDETVGLARRLQAELARFAPSNSFMYGLQDELIRIEVQLDIVAEEIRRLEAELRRQNTAQALQ